MLNLNTKPAVLKTFITVLIAFALGPPCHSARAQSSGQWIAIPIVSEPIAQHPDVRLGGEGGQVPLAIVTDAIDGQFMLYGTDVGGLFRSNNGGDTWEPANVGFSPRGATAFAIDPHHRDRVLAVGVNSLAMDLHGLYLSTDGAASWRPVNTASLAGMRDVRAQIAYDPSSFDESRGYSTDAYWSRIKDDKANYGKLNPDPAIYRSLDGGETWERLPGSERYGGGSLAVHPTKRGTVYVATEDGVFVSTDRAETFTPLKAGAFRGLAVSRAEPEAIFANTADAVWVSKDAGATWTRRAVTPAPSDNGSPRKNVILNQVNVSPVNPDHLTVRSNADDWQWRMHASRDGGETWTAAQFNNDRAFLPYNVRNWATAWHPTDADTVFSFGGDWATRSTDAGRTFHWHADGINTILVGGSFHFSPSNPDVVFIGSQDYNGALTVDGGQTWTYAPVSGKRWGGFTYGGMAADAQTLFVGNAESWGGDRVLRISRDGGKTWDELPDVRWAKLRNDLDAFGHMTSFVDPANPDVFFAGPFRSDDRGRTWDKMPRCDGVFTALAESPHTLYGVNHPTRDTSQLVTSTDHGATWDVAFDIDGVVKDIAACHDSGDIYFTHDNDLRVFRDQQVVTLNPPRDQFGKRRMGSVAIDPNRPHRIFATQNMDRYIAAPGAVMSDDRGATWQVLTVTEPLTEGVTDGGREPIRVRVHPRTGEAWFATSCFGLWKYRPARTD